MAFPTTGILDNFNRTDEGPPPSASWSAGYGDDGFKVVSNVAAPNNLFSVSYYNVATYGADAECYATITALPNLSVWLDLRLITPGGPSTVDGYTIEYQADSTRVAIWRVDDGALTLLGAYISVTFSAGDALGAEAIGSAISAYRKTGGSWGALGSRTDSTYGSAGYIAMGSYAATTGIRLDDFGGGTVVTGGGTAVPVFVYHLRQQEIA